MKHAKLILGTLAVLLLAVFGTIVTVSSVHFRNERIRKADDELADRWRIYQECVKITAMQNGFYATLEDEEDSEALYEALFALQDKASQRATDPAENNGQLDITKLGFSYSYPDSSPDEIMYYEYPLFSDQYGNQFYVWENNVGVFFSGFFYGDQLQVDVVNYQEGSGELEFVYKMSFSGMNALSISKKELLDEAKKIVGKKTEHGFYGNYRYLYTTMKTDAETSKALPDGTQEQNFVFFTDMTEELSVWKKYTVWNVLFALGAYIVVMTVMAILLLKPEKKNGAESVPDSEDPDNISPSMAQKILDYVESAEQSMGPNGYLDEVKNAISSALKDGSDKSE